MYICNFKKIQAAMVLPILLGSPLIQAQEIQNLAPIVSNPVSDMSVISGTSLSLDLNAIFSDPDVESAVVINTVFGRIYSALYATEMPVTVRNFLGYVEQTHPSGGGYTGQGASGTGETFFHRSPGTGFVIQAGSFYTDADGAVEDITTDAPIALETSATSPKNFRGTFAMARTTVPDSATSGFYINTSDNNNLDYVDAARPGYAVFGRVLGNGMAIVDQIDNLPTANLEGPFSALPVNDLNGNSTIDFPDDLATISEVSIINPLAYSIRVDDPTLVTPTLLEDGNVRFDFTAGRSGSTTVTLTATDLEGASTEHRFLFSVSDPTDPTDVTTRDDGVKILENRASAPSSRKVRFKTSASGDDYSGFLASEDGRKILGYFEGIVLKETRDFSARMIFGNTNYALKGRINKKGRYSKVITPEKGKDVTVNLRLVKTESGNYKLRGTVQRGKKTAVVVVVKSGQVDSLAGRYTLLIPGEEAASTKPQGHGYGAMQVMSGGTAKLTGLLGDGSKWTAECNVTSDGEMPLFSTLYLDDKGWVGGLVSFRDIEGVSDCDGTVHWRKPGNKKNRFSLVRDLIGSRYKRERVIAGDPATKPNVMADVGAGDGDASQAWELAWNAGNKKRLVYTGSGGAKLIVRRKKGLTEFYLTDPQLGQTKVGDGVVFQKQDIAAGTYYTEGKTRRSLVITPVE